MGKAKALPVLKSMTFWVNGKEVTAEEEELHIYAASHECELCGTHGEVTVAFKGPDGKRVEVELEDW